MVVVAAQQPSVAIPPGAPTVVVVATQQPFVAIPPGAPAMKRTSKKSRSRDVRLFLERAEGIAKGPKDTSSWRTGGDPILEDVGSSIAEKERKWIKMNTKFPTLTSITLTTPSKTPLSIAQKRCLAYPARRQGDPFS